LRRNISDEQAFAAEAFVRYPVFTQAQLGSVGAAVCAFLTKHGFKYIENESNIKLTSPKPTVYYEGINDKMRLFGNSAMMCLEETVREQNKYVMGSEKAKVVWKYSSAELEAILGDIDPETLAEAKKAETQVRMHVNFTFA
jgi:hypothetical protein